MEQQFKRDFSSLDAIFEFIGRFLSSNSVREDVSFSINLAVEELFTNMVKYNSGTGQQIGIRIRLENSSILLQLTDSDVDPFDPAGLGKVDVDQKLEDRKAGGLGLHLVKSVVDKITYEYRDRTMTVTVCKNLDSA